MTEQLKLADKIENWSPESKHPLTLIAHERRLVVAALRAIPAPDARVREALEAFAKTADAYEASHDGANKALEDEASCEKTTPVLRPPLSDTCRVSVTLGDCRIARATLQRVPANQLASVSRPDARVREAAEYVLANFKKSEADGYRSRDRQFAIAILDKALALPSSSPSVDGIIEFLSHCGEADIEAGIGALLSIGSEYKISSFKNSLLAALANDQSNCDDKC